MALSKRKPFESFADGYAEIFSVVNIAEDGDRPRDGLRQLLKLPFTRKTVGLSRYHEGMQDNVKIADVILLPYRPEVSTQHIVAVNGVQYKVWQVQFIPDTRPPSLKLSLERIVKNYDYENQAV